MIKTNPRKSTENKNKMHAAVQKVKIKNKTECIGFADKKTKKPQKQNTNNKKKCKANIEISKFLKIRTKKTTNFILASKT